MFAEEKNWGRMFIHSFIWQSSTHLANINIHSGNRIWRKIKYIQINLYNVNKLGRRTL